MRTLLLLLLLTLAAAAEPAVVRLEGALLQPRDISLESARRDWPALVQPIHYRIKGQEFSGLALPLLPVVLAAGLEGGTGAHPELPFAFLARGRDGYLAAGSLAELVPDIGHHSLLLVFGEDGASARLYYPDDASQSRSVFALETIRVIRLEP